MQLPLQRIKINSTNWKINLQRRDTNCARVTQYQVRLVQHLPFLSLYHSIQLEFIQKYHIIFNLKVKLIKRSYGSKYACCACHATCYIRVYNGWYDMSLVTYHVWDVLDLPLYVKYFSQKLCKMNRVNWAWNLPSIFYGVYVSLYSPIYFRAIR